MNMLIWTLRRTGKVAVIIIAALLLAGTTALAKKTTISYMCWVVGNEDIKAYQKIIDSFEKRNPTVQVKLNGVWWPGEAGYMSKLLTMTVANIAPDVVAMPFHIFPAVAEANLLTDLSSFVARSKDVNLNDWFPVGIKSAQWKGKLLALPTFGSTWWVHYNRRLFTEAGLVEPEQLYENGQWNIDAMASAAQKITRWTPEGKMDRIGILTYHDVIALNPWMRGFGGEFFDESKNRIVLDSEASIKAYSYVYDLIFAKKTMSLAGVPPYNTDHGSFARQGKFGMMAWWDSMAGQIRAMKVNWPINLVPFPKGPVRSDNINAQIHALTISRQSKNKDAAWAFLKFLAGKEGSSVLGRDIQWLTTRKDAQDAYKAGHLTTNSTGIKFLENALERTVSDPRARGLSDVLPKLVVETTKIWSGRADVPNGLRTATKVANAELALKKK